MSKESFAVILFALVCVSLMMLLVYAIIKTPSDGGKGKPRAKLSKNASFVEKMEHTVLVERLSNILPLSHLEVIFNRAKNPWHISTALFQTIRFVGLAAGVVAGTILLPITVWQVWGMAYACGVIAWWYPMYFYKATGDEREAEWNKMYEFIWVIKHNIMLYDPAKAYMNVKMYIQEHAPHDKEIIQGFTDFYEYWSPEAIDPYIEQYYPFSVPREITQILFNMNKTGEFPEDQLNSLRQFIINTQDLSVERTLSAVSSKATIFSLPFLMITIILCLMVPLVVEIVSMM